MANMTKALFQKKVKAVKELGFTPALMVISCLPDDVHDLLVLVCG